MRPLVLLLLILLAVSSAFAQGWQWQNPRVFGNTLSCVGSLEDGAVWASSEDGDLVWSSDTGQNWIVRNMLGGPLNKTVFTDPLHGWGLNRWQGYDDSAHAQILFTTDGGFSWAVQYNLPHEQEALLNDIQFLDSQHGWVTASLYDGVSSWGLLLRTTNSGLTWNETHLDTAAYNLSFIDTLHGWMSMDTLLWRTSDGGETWSPAPGHFPGAGLLRFVDSTHAWITSGGAHLFCDIYYTTNAGQTWTPQGVRLDLNHFYQDLEFVDGNTVYAVSDNGWVCETHDGGSHWSRQQPCGLTAFYGVHPADDQHAWAVGNGGIIIYTSDGGTHWAQQSGARTFNSGIEDIDFTDLHHGWVVGEDIAHTSDGGVSWTVQDTGNEEIWVASIQAVDSLSAWYCPSSHVLRHTTDGGASWHDVRPDPSIGGVILRAARYGSAYVWALAMGIWTQSDSAICRSSDGGGTWACYPLPQLWAYTYDMQFVTENTGWRVGGNDEARYGFVSGTSDGGQTWTQQYDFPGSAFRSVSFVDSLQGWTCGFGLLLHTADGGLHWDSIPSPPDRMMQVQFLDTLNGWSLCDGMPFRTSDGGSTWTASRAGTFFVTMDFVDDNHGWGAGGSGSIMKYDGFTSFTQPSESAPVQTFALSAYPNPFNPITILSFDVPKISRVTLSVYDLTGRLVQTLTDQTYAQGSYRVNFDGAALASGIYFARMQGHSFSKTQKLVLLK